jgi:hypothetical protein
MTKEIVTSDGEVIQTGVALTDTRLAVDLARAEIDGQIATAKQYPRSIQRVTGNILSLATLDVQAAEELNEARQALFRRAATRTG